MTLAPGTALGPYAIAAQIGTGGMGEVYQARDTRLNRLVAIKFLSSQIADESARRRFQQEAKMASALNHPHIVTVHEVGELDGQQYLVTEFVDGGTLGEWAQTEPRSWQQIVDLLVGVGDGLAAAHSAGILHRDIKPGNILVSKSGYAKLGDFGLSKLDKLANPETVTHTITAHTRPGAIIGTIPYMSPEQASGKALDARSDIFSFGVVLYELLAQRRPFRGATDLEVLQTIIHGTPEPLAAAVPYELRLLVEKALEKAPAERYQTMRDVVIDLKRIQRHSGAGTERDLARDGRPTRRYQARWVVAGVIATAVLIALAVWLQPSSTSETDVGAASATRRTVAVLPFRNLSDRRQDYFAAGMAESIHSQLSKMADLRVLSRQAVQRYASGDVRKMAEEWGAVSLVQGSVRTDSGRVVVAVELVDARTEQTLWSEEYNRQLQDIFTVQRDIALRVADRLFVTPTADERRRVAKEPTKNLAAYDLFLRAQTIACGDEKAIELLRKAVEMEPSFAVAQAEIAYHFVCRANVDPRVSEQAIQQAREAVRSDEGFARGHMALASAYSIKGRASDARAAFLRAIALDPSSTLAMDNLSSLDIELGRYDEALHWAARGFPPVPTASDPYFHVAGTLLFLGDDTVTERWLNEAGLRFPTSSRIPLVRAQLEVMRGDLAPRLSL
jgi:TolB-like protein